MAPSQKNFETFLHISGVIPVSDSERMKMYEAFIGGWEQNVIHDPVEEEKKRKEYKQQVIFTVVTTLINISLVIAWYLD